MSASQKSSEYDQIIQDLLNGQYDKYDTDEVIEILTIADDDYTNDGEGSSFELTDSQYDAIKLIAKRLAPAHVYFTGVGSDIRGSKVDLPNAMPSLNQVEIGEISQWVSENKLSTEPVVITDKMDGTSLQLIYDKEGHLQIAYSRGNGLQGADVTRHIRRMKNVPKVIPYKGGLEVRAEVELSETAFRKMQMTLTSQSGKRYKNARNMTAGQMNREESYPQFYENVDVFAYEVLNSPQSKIASLELLQSQGFKVVHYVELDSGNFLSDGQLSTYLSERREALDYAIDGLVITVNSCDKRKNMDVGISGKSNPKSSIKYKVADASNYATTEVLDIELNISKDGYIKPTIVVAPIDLVGVTVTRCTGFNMKFIHDNRIQPGCHIRITRSGDVIPLCLGVVIAGPYQ